jgi:hypothetical protein
MKRCYLIWILCVALLSGACTRDVQNAEEEYDPASLVRFVITDADGATRGTPITAASQVASIGVFASHTGTSNWTETATLGKMFNQRLNKNGSKWDYVGQDVSWGANSLADRYTFFAYAPYGTGNYDGTSNTSGNGIVVDTSDTTGTPTLTYTVPAHVENQPDLMVATKKNVRPTGAPVTLAMEHALTCVTFQVAGQGERVVDIKVHGVAMTGTLTIDGEHISWDVVEPTDTDTEFSVSLNSDKDKSYYTAKDELSTGLVTEDGHLMMIPQKLQPGAKVVVTYTNGTVREFVFGGDTWLPGQKLTYNIILPDPATPATNGAFLAPPGVIGYIKGTNKLTLKGSREYSANADIKQYAIDNFEGLSDSTVYVAYFKFGSLVAIGGDPGDTVLPYFDSLDVVQAPIEWQGSLIETRKYILSDYSKVPFTNVISGWANYDWYRTDQVKDDLIKNEPNNGKGDACTYYFGSKHGGGWTIPTGNAGLYSGDLPQSRYNHIDGMNDYGWDNNTMYKYPNTGDAGPGLPGGAMSIRDGERGMYYVRTGIRYGYSNNVTEGGRLSSAGSDAAAIYASSRIIFTQDHDNSPAYKFNQFYYDSGTIDPVYASMEGRGSFAQNHAVALRCVRPKATVTLSPSTTGIFPVEGETREFTISTTYFTGKPVVVSKPSWVTTSISDDGKTLTVKVARNTEMYDRSGTVTVTAGNNNARSQTNLSIVQSHTMGGVLAPPGVIGYIRGTNILTLKGSKEYANATYDGDGDGKYDIKEYAEANFGGLSDSTVYVAYFKWGSLVALSSDPNDNVKGANSNYIQANDIITGPEGYNLDQLKAIVTNYPNSDQYTWNSIPVNDNTSVTYISTQDLANGKGDPCKYYFGSDPQFQTGHGFDPAYSWRLPAGNPYNGYTDNSFWPYVSWYSSAGAGLPGGIYSPVDGEKGMFYPSTGHRHENTGQIDDTAGGGPYWANAAPNNDRAYFLYFTGGLNGDKQLFQDYYRKRGHAVRCVKDVPVITLSTYSHTFPTKEPASMTFDVTPGKYTGDIFVSTPYSWITAEVDQDAQTVKVTVTENTDTGALNNPYRTGYVTVWVGTEHTGKAATSITIKQRHTVGGVLAPPGVIGYIKGTNELTLQGSKEYKGTLAENYAVANFGGLSDKTVYVAYFKWGSLVAMSGDPLDVNTEGSRYLQSEDIVAGPSDDWAGYSTLKNATYPNWGSIPYTSASSISADYANGKGDPCAYYFGDKYQTGLGFDTEHTWRMPALENVTSNGYNNWWYNGYMPNFWDGTWYNASGSIPQGRYSVRTGESGMFYPATGYRESSDDGSGSGQIKDQSYRSIYWTNTYLTENKSYYLEFDGSGPGALDGNWYRFRGLPVRCVKDRPTVSVPSTSYSFPAPATTVTVNITTTNYSIAPDIIVNDAAKSWLSTDLKAGTEAGKYTLTVTLKEQEDVVNDRTGYINITVGSSYTGYDNKQISVTQRHSVGGVEAPPGVIGYIKNTGELTLKGSVGYKTAITTDTDGDGTNDIEQYANANFGGLSDKTVYVAFFKFGSLVALSSDRTDDKPDANGRYIQTDDIIAGPSQWSGYNSLKSNPTYNAVPFWRDNGTYVYPRETVGLGDPCIYYFTNHEGYTGNWRLPTGPSYNNALSSFYAYPETGYPYGNYNTGYRDKYSTNVGMFYPNTGMRKVDSGYEGQIEQYLYGGLYWSSTSDGGTWSYYLYFNKYDNKFEYSGHWDGNRAGAVRCFPQ